MREKNIKLSYYQTMIFVLKLDEIKKNKESIYKELISKYEKYIINRTCEIVNMNAVVLKLMPILGMYSFTVEQFNQLVDITGVNPCDNSVYNYYLPLIKEREKNSIDYFNEKCEKSNRCR